MTIKNNQGGDTILVSHFDLAQQSLKNARQRCIETLQLGINRLHHLQALTTDADYGNDLAQTRADLKTKLAEQAHYSSRKHFALDLGASERCSNFFFRPPQVLHRTLIPVDCGRAGTYLFPI
ncbi:hypothetical protein PsorP6_000568 [Peronosclerospora sorghi]|uniref:Uncharacterized protein n=1 Tax=Peronosclerospora sorghi TaxID=230839 RepID=A0ACC0WVM3_9STRA|nr:hypothetical protein PsorP6_000568 [Peronosclerospora sorghi]